MQEPKNPSCQCVPLLGQEAKCRVLARVLAAHPAQEPNQNHCRFQARRGVGRVLVHFLMQNHTFLPAMCLCGFSWRPCARTHAKPTSFPNEGLGGRVLMRMFGPEMSLFEVPCQERCCSTNLRGRNFLRPPVCWSTFRFHTLTLLRPLPPPMLKLLLGKFSWS